MSLAIEPLNLPEVERQMHAWGRSLQLKVLETVIREEIEPLKEEVRRQLEPHVRTGVMSGGVEVIRKGPGAIAINLADQYHGQMLEWGSSREPAQAPLRKALDAQRDALVAGVRNRLRQFLAAAR